MQKHSFLKLSFLKLSFVKLPFVNQSRTFSLLLLLGLLSISHFAYAVDESGSSSQAQAALAKIIDGSGRSQAHIARDRYRHPLQTLTFFGLEANLSVAEIWPGGRNGWYREILSLFLAKHGHYIPISGGSGFPGSMEDFPKAGVDLVLVFRAHGFMIYQKPVEQYYQALYRMLKPGGIFAIVDHRGDETVAQDPNGANGYVNQSHVIKLAESVGFKLLASSEINANAKDSKDHPHGLYSLPPTLKGTFPLSDQRNKFLAIGESDRMTLKFRKPKG